MWLTKTDMFDLVCLCSTQNTQAAPGPAQRPAPAPRPPAALDAAQAQTEQVGGEVEKDGRGSCRWLGMGGRFR